MVEKLMCETPPSESKSYRVVRYGRVSSTVPPSRVISSISVQVEGL